MFSPYPGRGDRDRSPVCTNDIDDLVAFGAVLRHRGLDRHFFIKHELPCQLLAILARKPQGLLEPLSLRSSYGVLEIQRISGQFVTNTGGRSRRAVRLGRGSRRKNLSQDGATDGAGRRDRPSRYSGRNNSNRGLYRIDGSDCITSGIDRLLALLDSSQRYRITGALKCINDKSRPLIHTNDLDRVSDLHSGIPQICMTGRGCSTKSCSVKVANTRVIHAATKEAGGKSLPVEAHSLDPPRYRLFQASKGPILVLCFGPPSHSCWWRRNHAIGESVDRGGERAAAMYSLIVTAKLNDVDPRAWLADVLARIGDHSALRLSELLPWNSRQHHPMSAAA